MSKKITPGSIPLTVIILSNRSDDRFVAALNSVQPAKEVIVWWVSENKPPTNKYWQELQLHNHFTLYQKAQNITDFAAARNEILTKATYPWVFFVDSDEEITPQSWTEVAHFVSQNQVHGVYVKRQDVFLGKQLRWGEVKDVHLLRLARTDRLKFIRPVHEVGYVSTSTVNSNITIIHHSHLNVSDFLLSVTRYAHMEALHKYRQGERFSLFQLTCYPVGKFWKNWLLKLGFLDGFHGLIYAVMMSFHSVMVRIFLYEQYQQEA